MEDDGGSVTIATTRPETLLGDTAVAVNPEDERYSHLIGRKAVLPVLGRVIPVIADEAVELEFGTGALKVTPGHDPNDFEIGQRHDLPSVNVMELDGTMNENAGPYRGQSMSEARENIVRELEEDGLLEKVEPYQHSVGHCDRCDETVEPIVTRQWWMKMGPVARPARAAVADGRIEMVPERFAKVYFNWMDNIRDWCVSRQLWWGHRLPVWYCQDCKEVVVELQDPGVVHQVRFRSAGARPRRSRYLVQLRTLAALDPGLARPDRGPSLLLPRHGLGNGPRHPLLLGRANGDDGT